MKKLVSILLFIVGISVYSQDALKVSKELNDTIGLTDGPYYGLFWGSSNDTLTASDSLSQIIRIKGLGLLQMEFKLHCNKTSGTVTNKFIIYKSLIPYPYEWVKVDSIVNTNISTGFIPSKTLSNWIAPYMLVQGESGATSQLAEYDAYFIFRY